jgi:hypothetical protein
MPRRIFMDQIHLTFFIPERLPRPALTSRSETERLASEPSRFMRPAVPMGRCFQNRFIGRVFGQVARASRGRP